MNTSILVRAVMWPVLGVVIGAAVAVLLLDIDLDGGLILTLTIVTVCMVAGSLGGTLIRGSTGPSNTTGETDPRQT